MLEPLWQKILLFLVVVLLLGPQVLLCLFASISGVLIVLYVVSQGRTFAHLRNVRQPWRQPKIKPLEDDPYDIESDLSGYTAVDQELNNLIHLVLRDYVMHWHTLLTHTNHFPAEVHNVLVLVSRTLVKRLKNVDWVSFVTNRVLDEVSEHIRLFKIANSESSRSNVTEAFFDAEAGLLSAQKAKSPSNEPSKIRSVSRDAVCTSSDDETIFLSDLVELLLFLLMPKEHFDALGMRLLVREIVVSSVLKPSLDLVSEPDFVNQTVIWLYGDRLVKPEYFLQVIRCSDSIEELNACDDKVSREISQIKTQDSKLHADSSLKLQLESLLSLQQTIEHRIERLNSPRANSEDAQSILSVDKMDWSERVGSDLPSLFSLPVEVVLKNNIALSYFVDFMTSVQCQHYVFFFLNVEGWRMSSAQQLQSVFNEGIEDVSKSGLLNGMREAAHAIFSEYLQQSSDNYIAEIDESLSRRLLFRIRTESPDPQWFDETQNAVVKLIEEDERLIQRFKKTVGYVKLLAELDLLNVTDGREALEEVGREEREENEVENQWNETEDADKTLIATEENGNIRAINEGDDNNNGGMIKNGTSTEEKSDEMESDLALPVLNESIADSNQLNTDDSNSIVSKEDDSENDAVTLALPSTSHKRSCSDGANSINNEVVQNEAKSKREAFKEQRSPLAKENDVNTSSESPLLSVKVIDVEVSRDWKGKALAYYKLEIERNGIKELIKRRYSDFYTLHERILAYIEDEKLKETLAEFPCKKTFGNMDRELLLTRKTMFDTYIKKLLEHSSNSSLLSLLSNFLSSNGSLRRSATSTEITIPASIQQRSKVKMNLAKALNKVDNFKGGITKAFQKPSQGLQTQPSRLSATLPPSLSSSQSSMTASSSSLTAAFLTNVTSSSSSLTLSYEDEADSSTSNTSSNIPLRVISVLLDEIFELRTRHAWLRRQSMAMLKQLLSAMFGDIFHRRFLDIFKSYTSSASLAQCLKSIREALWPQGYPAQFVERDASVKARTRLTSKAVFFSWLPDDLRRIIGSETTRVGLLNLFDMLQHQELNKRLCYVIIEALLEVVFPAVGFRALISKMHAKRSSRSNNEKNNNESGDKVNVLRLLRQVEGHRRTGSWSKRSTL